MDKWLNNDHFKSELAFALRLERSRLQQLVADDQSGQSDAAEQIAQSIIDHLKKSKWKFERPPKVHRVDDQER